MGYALWVFVNGKVAGRTSRTVIFLLFLLFSVYSWGSVCYNDERSMKRLIHIIVGCVGAALLSACGVQIQMQTLKPAEIDLGRGAAMTVCDCVSNHASRALADAFRLQIAKDGFYAQYPSDVCLELHNVYIKDAPPHGHRDRHKHGERKHEEKSHPTPYLCGVVTVMERGRQIYRRDYRESIWLDSKDRMQLREACEDFAEEIMDELTPRQVAYYEYVTPDETNPALEQAARACSVGNWANGKQLVENALRQNPNCAEAYYLLGLIARNDREFRSSDNYFYRANALRPSSKYADALQDNARLQQNEARAGWQMN